MLAIAESTPFASPWRPPVWPRILIYRRILHTDNIIEQNNQRYRPYCTVLEHVLQQFMLLCRFTWHQGALFVHEERCTVFRHGVLQSRRAILWNIWNFYEVLSFLIFLCGNRHIGGTTSTDPASRDTSTESRRGTTGTNITRRTTTTTTLRLRRCR